MMLVLGTAGSTQLSQLLLCWPEEGSRDRVCVDEDKKKSGPKRGL